jgi:hypothetical protein
MKVQCNMNKLSFLIRRIDFQLIMEFEKLGGKLKIKIEMNKHMRSRGGSSTVLKLLIQIHS